MSSLNCFIGISAGSVRKRYSNLVRMISLTDLIQPPKGKQAPPTLNLVSLSIFGMRVGEHFQNVLNISKNSRSYCHAKKYKIAKSFMWGHK